jgi:serine phosphatase RsbU (regulator of sigma subunit)
MKSFRVKVILRVFLLTVSVFLLFYLNQHGSFIATSVIFSFLVILQVITLIRFVEKTNRELSKFFLSVKHSDFSQSFLNKNLGPSFMELSNSLSSVLAQFQQARSEKEEHFQYLQTIVRHIGTGMISFRDNGQVELINNAAKDLFGLNDLKNIQNLSSYNSELVSVLQKIEPGERALVKVEDQKLTRELSLFATEIKLRGEKFTLVSIQDISSELERERLASELSIARQVQRKLLPTTDPSINGFSIAGLCIPANEVGGDYYDFIELGDNKLGMVIADVSGKGLPAAFYMTLTKGIFQSYAKSFESPREVLIKVNSLLYHTIERGSFVTMFYAVLDKNFNKITFARAGHEPAIHVKSETGQTVFLRPPGIGLGLEDGNVFSKSITDTEIILNSGELFFLYTDGFTDSRNKLSQEFGQQSIISLLNNLNKSSAPEILKSIAEEISKYSKGVPQFDDMTFIAVKCNHNS